MGVIMGKIQFAFKYFPRERKTDDFFVNFLRENYFQIKFVNEKKADFLLFSTFNNKNTLEMPKVSFKGKKIFWTGENCRIDKNKTDFAFGFDYEEDIKNNNYLRLPLYVYYGAGRNLIKPSDYNPQKILEQKTKFCNYVYSKDSKERVEFFKKLSKYKKIDAPGNSMNNTRSVPSKKYRYIVDLLSYFDFISKKYKPSALFSRHFSDWRKDIIEYQKKYKFTIAFENSSYPGYTTEKIYHPMLANSIPIYWGNPEISKDFNKKSFINYYDYNDLDKLVDVVIDLDQNDKKYMKKLKQPWLKGNKLNKWMYKARLKRQFDRIFFD